MFPTKLLALTLILFGGCTNSRQNNVIQFLTNGSKKYWIRIREYPIKRYSSLYFSPDGTYKKYSVFKGERRFVIPNYYTVWRLAADSTLLMGDGRMYKIEYLDDNVLILNEKSVRHMEVYVKEEDQKTVP
jgi:hypothetical protein